MRRMRDWAGVMSCSVLSIILYLFNILYANQSQVGQAQLWSKCAFAAFCVVSAVDLFLALHASRQEGRRSFGWFTPLAGALLCCWGCNLLLR